MENELLAQALEFAALGRRPFPIHTINGTGTCSCHNANCKSPGKHPRLQRGFKDGTNDREVIERWWRTWPDANLAIRTGPESGLMVIDVDPRHGGLESVKGLIEKVGGLPPPAVRTGGGGWHYYLRYPEGLSIRSGEAVLGPGLDVKAIGGYVLTPPSSHRSGDRYRWLSRDEPGEPSPELIRLLEARRQEPRKTAAGGRIPAGERHGRLVSIAGSLRRQGLSPDLIFEHLKLTRDRACEEDPNDPLGDRELEEIAGWVARHDPEPDEIEDPEDYTPVVDTLEKLLQKAQEGSEPKVGFLRRAADEIASMAPVRGDRPVFEWRILCDPERAPDLTPPRAWIQDLLFEGLVLWAGRSKISFKTHLALTLALAIRRGSPVLGRQTTQAKVGFIQRDMPENQFHEFADRLANGHGWYPTGMEYTVFPCDFRKEEDRRLIRTKIEDEGIQVVFIDSLRGVWGGNENKSEEVAPLMRSYLADELRDGLGVTPVLLHHVGKMGDVRGSTDLEAAADSIWKFKSLSDDPRDGKIQVSVLGRHPPAVLKCQFEWTPDGTVLRLLEEAEADEGHGDDLVRKAREIVINASNDGRPISRRDLRDRLEVRWESMSHLVSDLLLQFPDIRESEGARKSKELVWKPAFPDLD